jgi:SAM-dependent methyltransferase
MRNAKLGSLPGRSLDWRGRLRPLLPIFGRIRRQAAPLLHRIESLQVPHNDDASVPSGTEVAEYWTRTNVTSRHQFSSAEDSLAYFRWRNDNYFGYIELMPVAGQDGKTVLDFGCGPGHDLVGFSSLSKPARLIGMDVSPSSLAEAEARLALHDAACELVLLDPGRPELPLPSGSVDYVHSSGVLHHLPDILATLRELRRVLRPDGMARFMVYNRDSVFVHLYVAYQRCILDGAFPGLSLDEAFRGSTDGPNCPISQAYSPAAFVSLCEHAGFEAEFSGAAVSMLEAKVMPIRFDAIVDRGLGEESRRFLMELTLDPHGMPWYRNHRAGIDGCYLLRPRG